MQDKFTVLLKQVRTIASYIKKSDAVKTGGDPGHNGPHALDTRSFMVGVQGSTTNSPRRGNHGPGAQSGGGITANKTGSLHRSQEIASPPR